MGMTNPSTYLAIARAFLTRGRRVAYSEAPPPGARVSFPALRVPAGYLDARDRSHAAGRAAPQAPHRLPHPRRRPPLGGVPHAPGIRRPVHDPPPPAPSPRAGDRRRRPARLECALVRP